MAPSPPHQNALTLATSLAFWVSIILVQSCHISAWLVMPRTLLSHSTSRTAHGTHKRKTRAWMSSSPIPDVNSVSDDQGARVTILRSLYDAPPQLPVSDETSYSNASWETEVTLGKLPTENGSSHLLHYEVHRRYRRCVKNENNQQSPSLTGLFLHGGPGAGCYPNHVRFFNPELYDTVVLLDQRGCGKSSPSGETRNNTLELLVEDVERLRIHLLDQPWDVILGGSWGVTLAMAYAHKYRGHVRAMVLRGVCLFRNREIDWLFGDPPLSDEPSSARNGGGVRTSNLRSLLAANNRVPSRRSLGRGGDLIAQTGIEPTTMKKDSESSATQNTASQIFREEWKEFTKGSNIATLPALEKLAKQRPGKNPRSALQRYYQYLLGDNPSLRLQAVKSWFRWEMGIYSAGFSKEKKGGNMYNALGILSKSNNTVLVWHPSIEAWTYEDARVKTNHSCCSIDVDPTAVKEEVVQSLRRFSSSPSSQDFAESGTPIPVQPMAVFSKMTSPASKTNNINSGNKTFDPTTYIPSQAMLTCYYSLNDDFCIGPYKLFLSMTPPSSIPLSSWFSSKLPPKPPQSSPTALPLRSKSSSTTSFPLPPTIAIQGGNDAICPLDTALDLHDVWRSMELRIVLSGGHSMYDPVIAGEIVKALDRFGRELLGDAVVED